MAIRVVDTCYIVDSFGVKVEKIKYAGFQRCTMSQAKDSVVSLHPGRIVRDITYMRDNDQLWLTLRRNEQFLGH